MEQRIFEIEDLKELEEFLQSQSEIEQLRERLFAKFLKYADYKNAGEWNKAVRLCESLTSDKYKETVRKQLPSVPPHHILTEPVARNTAPCITYACWKIKKHHPHANIV